MGNLRYHVWFRSLSLSLMGKGASFSYVIPVEHPDCYADSSLSDRHFLKAVFMSLISPYHNKNIPVYICRNKLRAYELSYETNSWTSLAFGTETSKELSLHGVRWQLTIKPTYSYTWSWKIGTVNRWRRALTHCLSLDVGSLVSSLVFGVYKVHGWGPISQIFKEFMET